MYSNTIHHMFCMCCSYMAFHFNLRFFYLNPTKATKERLPQNPMETIKAETAQNIPPRRFQLGTPESLQKPNQRPCEFIHNGECWEGWEKLDILWSSWHFLGVEYLFPFPDAPTVSCTLHEPFCSIQWICARTSNAPQASDTYWFGGLDSVHEATTFWRFPGKTKIRSHPKKNPLIVVFTWNDYTSIPDKHIISSPFDFQTFLQHDIEVFVISRLMPGQYFFYLNHRVVLFSWGNARC